MTAWINRKLPFASSDTFILLGFAATFAGITLYLGGTQGVLILGAALVVPFIVSINGAPLWVFAFLFPLLYPFQGVQGLSGAKGLAILCFGAWVIGVLVGAQRLSFRFNSLDVVVLVLFILSFISILTMTERDIGTYVQVYAQNLWLYFLARSVCTTRQRASYTLWAFTLGTSIAALVALWQFTHGHAISSEYIDRLGLSGSEVIGINNLAAIFLAGLGMSLGLMIYSRGWRRVLTVVMSIVLGWAVLLSQSRGGYIAAFVMLVCGLVLLRHRTARLTLTGLTALSGVLLFLPGVAATFRLGSFADRAQTIFAAGSTGTVETQRTYLWQMAYQAMLSHPWNGLGTENFTVPAVWAMEAQKNHVPFWVIGPNDAHNLYLAVGADLGIAGFTLICLAVVIGLKYIITLLRSPQTTDRQVGLIASALLLSFPAYFTASIFVPNQDLPVPYLLLGIVSGVASIKVFRGKPLAHASGPPVAMVDH